LFQICQVESFRPESEPMIDPALGTTRPEIMD
jgi:hypothetical protein